MSNLSVARAETDAASESVAQDSSYGFVRHSSAAPWDPVPTTTDERAGRQKRKRTSPEDQALLEAAYNRDSKPDKATRSELVKQVSLSDKEVQIWFQNRRQNTRRKSRPLLPHEIAQYQLSRSSLATSLPYFQDGDSEPRGDSNPRPTMSAETIQFGNSDVDNHLAASTSSDITPTSPMHAGQTIDFTAPVQKSPRSASSSIGYLSNRRSAPSLLSALRAEAPASVNDLLADQPSVGSKKSSSFVRLMMTADGKAEITTKNDSSPSPPRASQLPLSFGHLSSVPASVESPVLSSGRSRDSRSWEFWCDKDSRNELENRAVKDASGSATGAIGLIRCSSGRRILGNLSSKSNPSFRRISSSAKRSRQVPRRLVLQKSHTAFGRLQDDGDECFPFPTSMPPTLKSYNSADSTRIPGNESDKENWSPAQESDSAESSGDTFGASQQSSHDSNLKQHVRSGEADSKKMGPGISKTNAWQTSDRDPRNGHSITSFVGHNRSVGNPSEEDDLDCVQGLLSLSQGNWR